jgi:spoIIIJ-associated protein
MTDQNLSAEAGQDSDLAPGASGPSGVPGDLAEEGASASEESDAQVVGAVDSQEVEERGREVEVRGPEVEEGQETQEGQEAWGGTVEGDADYSAETRSSEESTDDEAAGPARVSNRRAQLEREGEVAADFLETLLDIADLDGDIDVDIEGDRAAVAIVDSEDGRVPRRLVGQDGRVLEALQELTRLAVQSATGERSRLMLDIAGHRAERRSALVEVARAAIGRVKESGEPRSLEPMSAFERKVIHDEVLAAGLVSESDGVEPRRFVVIHPA